VASCRNLQSFGSWVVPDRDKSASEEVGEPEIAYLNVAGLFCCRTSSLNQFYCALIILVHDEGRHGNALVCKEAPCPEALLESFGYGHKLRLA
jgi:hypothetical protein